MTTDTNVSAPSDATNLETLQAMEQNNRPLIPGGAAGERFMEGQGTQEDLDLAIRAGSDTPETQPPPAPAPESPETPTPASTPIPTEPGGVDISTLTQEQIISLPFVQELQARERELTQQVVTATQKDTQTQLQNAENQYATQAARDFVEKDHLTQEVAQRLALREAQRERQLFEQRNQMQNENKVRMDTAVLYAKQYGVPVESLIQGSTSKEMELMARLQKLEAGPPTGRGPANGKTEIPAQRFDNGIGGGGADPTSRLAAIGRGEIVPTEADMNTARRLGYV